MDQDQINQQSEETIVMQNSSEMPSAIDEENSDFVYTSEWLKAYTDIHGWLTFFLFALALGGLVSAGYSIFSINLADYAGNVFLLITDLLPGISLLGIALYTIYAFVNRKPNAVFWGRVYVLAVLVTNCLSICFGEFEATGLNTIQRAAQSIVWSIVWFLYLAFSKQVKEIIPKPFRKVTKLDWGIVAGVILLPVICFVIGYAQITNLANDRTANEKELLLKNLANNERTDGKIVFAIPASYTCSHEDIDAGDGVTIRLFSIENENSNCGLCSYYDENKTRENFESYRTNWQDENMNDKTEKAIDEGSSIINGNDALYKIVSYDVDGVDVYWRFYLLFNKSTGKVAILSAYDTNEDTSYLYELIKSIRFQ